MSGENILVVVLDDMRYDFQPYALNLATWSARRFTNARCNVGLCQPYRTGLLTGQVAFDHGEYGNADPKFDQDNDLGAWVQAAGYRTGLFGKYLNSVDVVDATPPPAGWTIWRQLVTASAYDQTGFGVWDGATTTYPSGTHTAWLRDEVLDFADGTEPWFAYVCPTAPHFEFWADPDDLFRWSHVFGPHPPDDVTGKPSWFTGRDPLDRSVRASFERAARGQAREISDVDQRIQEIVDGLDALGQLDNTVVIVVADNGLNFGENRQPGPGSVKNDLTQASIHVPLICRGPGFTEGETATPVGAEIDITATIVAITGATPGLGSQAGIDLRTTGAAPDADRTLLHERSGGGVFDFIGHDGIGVSTVDRKLMLWVAVTGNDRFEMYDLDSDPTEQINVANDAGRLTERTALKATLDTLAPVSHEPNFLYGVASTTDGTTLESSAITIPPEYLVMIDVYGSIVGSFTEDFEVSAPVAFLSDVEQIGSPVTLDADGFVTRRLVSWRARGSGELGTVTVTSGPTLPTLTSLGFVVTYYNLYNGIVQTVTASGNSAATTFSATLATFQQADHHAHYAILRNPSSAASDDTTGEGTEIFDQGHANPNCRFSVYNSGVSDVTPTATGGSSDRWGVIAHEIGT